MFILTGFWLFCHSLFAASSFTIFHTNDWHSQILGFGPNSEYSPETINDDDTLGGVSRRAALLKARRAIREKDGVTLTLDGGDFMMGSLFHTLNSEEAFELRLLSLMKYDAITLGNHDFEWGPDGLAKMIEAALRRGAIPKIVAANTQLSASDQRDDQLAKLFQQGHIKKSTVIIKSSLTFGVIGLIGNHAVEVTKTAAPLVFSSAIAAAKEQVRLLKQKEVDVVIALSHSGVWFDDGKWGFEDVELAKAVPQIDIIVSGHSHQLVKEPIIVGKTIIVQAGALGKHLGELTVQRKDDGSLKVIDNKLHLIDDKIMGDQETMDEVAQMGANIEQKILAPRALAFDEAVVETDRDLTRDFDDHLLANLVTDSIRLAAKSDFAFTGNGTIRSNMKKGRTGVQSVADVFRIAPLGKGYTDSAPGYPLIKAHLTGPEVKTLVEVFLLAYTTKGPPYFPRVSGIRIHYNPLRLPFDRVYRIDLGDDDKGYKTIDLSGKDGKSYSFACTVYVGKFVWAMENLSKGILQAAPKGPDGKPIPTPIDAIVDGNKAPGVQEIKEWEALINHLKSLPDTDGNGIANIPLANSPMTKCRIIENSSLAPAHLLGNATWIMWSALIVFLGFIMVVALLMNWLRRKLSLKRDTVG